MKTTGFAVELVDVADAIFNGAFVGFHGSEIIASLLVTTLATVAQMGKVIRTLCICDGNDGNDGDN